MAAALGMARGDILDLSASLCPVAPDPSPVVAAHLDALGRYPDPGPATEALAEVMGVDPDHLLLTNGGSEAISLLAARRGGQVAEPDFSLYPRHGGPRWRSNPNSPLGTLAGSDERCDVWDEAFWPLATGTWTRGDHLDGAVVLGSLTKLLACPGLRAGYLLSTDRVLLGQLRRAQPAWAVNGLLAEAMADLLAPVDLPRWRDATDALREQLAAVLVRHGLVVRTGRGPWVLVERAGGLRERLARHGIVVRDCTSFSMPGTVRIAVPRPAGLDRLDEALGRILARADGPATRPAP